MFAKIKPILSDDAFFMALLLCLSSTLAFGLGRLSVAPAATTEATASLILSEAPSATVQPSTQTSPIQLPQPTIAAPVTVATGAYVASKNGSRYHLPTCPGAKQITEANKIWFNSVADALAAGYTPAANCPGL